MNFIGIISENIMNVVQAYMSADFSFNDLYSSLAIDSDVLL